MTDQELQQLFEAKRTTEANRQRREALSNLIAAQTSGRKRRLWPVWIGSAAACIALLLLFLPHLFTTESTSTQPMQVAQHIVPQPTAIAPTPAPSSSKAENKSAKTISPNPTATQTDTPLIVPEPTQEVSAIEDITPAPQTVETDTLFIPEVPTSVPTSPTILRRTTNQIACTQGCTAPDAVDIVIPTITIFGYGTAVADAALYNFHITR